MKKLENPTCHLTAMDSFQSLVKGRSGHMPLAEKRHSKHQSCLLAMEPKESSRMSKALTYVMGSTECGFLTEFMQVTELLLLLHNQESKMHEGMYPEGSRRSLWRVALTGIDDC
uniref:Uncharacterized protein n=1 Tax=Sphaerodactylus townsendi TaxID=933632 RepID=A0ACB8E4P8_9SAUR